MKDLKMEPTRTEVRGSGFPRESPAPFQVRDRNPEPKGSGPTDFHPRPEGRGFQSVGIMDYCKAEDISGKKLMSEDTTAVL